jgi:hypothetical protein
MSAMKLLINIQKMENGIIWGGIFGLSVLPIQLGISKFLIPKLEFKEDANNFITEQSFKLLLSTFTVVGFIYGYNTKHRFVN